MSRRCENCGLWGSTDRVWGECDYAGRKNEDHKAQATYVKRMGDVRDARLETRYDFGCKAWSSGRPKNEARHA